MSQTKELHNYTYFGISDKGNFREYNEDRFAHIESINGSVFVLCDGMGGVKGGDIAAEITIKSIEYYVSENWEDDPILLIKNAIDIANTDVYNYFKNENSLLKAGTTLVFVLIRNNKVYYAHVGDSRIYYMAGKKLFPITTDHSYVMNLVQKNIISYEEAREHPRRNEILKAIGIKKNVEPTICKKPLTPADNDLILLCSDGLTTEIEDTVISSVLSKKNKLVEVKAKQLTDKALKNGGSDNITVQLISFYNTGNKKHVNFKQTKNTKINLRFIILPIIFIIALIIFFFMLKANKETDKTKDLKNSSLLFYKKHKNDTLINIFVKNGKNLKEILSSYNLKFDEIGHASSLVKKNEYVKYYIPVKVVYKYQVGKNIFSYPEINSKNIIDIIIVNNKNELFFKPCENIIIP